MRIGERTGDVAQNAHDLGDGKGPALFESCAKALAFDAGHRVIQDAALERTGRQQGYDVWMLKSGGKTHLALEALDGKSLGQFAVQHLHDDSASECRIDSH